MILPPCFLTQEEMKDAPSEDLYCEIADAMFCSSPEVDSYIKRIHDELKGRN